MAGSALLEREIEKITGETQEVQQKSVTTEELEHQRRMSENLSNLLNRDESLYNRAATAEYSERPAYDEYTSFERHAPVVPTSSEAPSASSRIADYMAYTKNLETMRQRSNEVYGHPALETYEPVDSLELYNSFENDYAPSYEEELYRQGVLMDASIAPAIERIEAPTYSPSYAPVEAPAFEEDDDALPTRKTLDTLRRDEVEDEAEEYTFFSALSTRTKIVLAAVCATIVLLLTIICINTAVLKGINSDVALLQGQLNDLQATYGQIESEIADITSPESIADWASSLDDPMTPPPDWNY